MKVTEKQKKSSKKILPIWLASVVIAFAVGRFSSETPVTSQNYYEPDRGIKKDEHKGVWEQKAEGRKAIFSKTPDSNKKGSQFTTFPTGHNQPNIDRLFKSRDPLTRLSNFVEVLGNLGPHNIESVKSAFETLQSGTARKQEMELLFHAWSKFAPKDAIAYGNSLDKTESSFAVRAALASWSSYDAPNAIKWVEQEIEENKQDQYQVGIIQGVATFDTDAATDLLLEMKNSNYRFQASSALVKNLTGDDLAKAMNWATELPEDEPHIKTTVIGQVAHEVARQDPERCAEWALTLDEGDSRKRIVSTVINYWSRKSYKATADWVQQFPEGNNRYYAIEQMVNQWAWRNPVDTANWLNQFPSSEKLDPAIDNFARRIMHKEPVTAADWAKSIIDADRRNKSLDNVFKSWKKKEPEEALAWAESNAPELLSEIER